MEIKLLSIIVPIYKQEKIIKTNLLNIYNVLQKTPYKFEIIGVVDGTSIDKSYQKAKQMKKPEIKIYGYKSNKGKGQAIRYGMKKSNGDVITFIDSGMEIDPSGIIMLLEHMKWYNADIIVGSKLHPASIVKNYKFKRKVLTLGYYTLVKTLFGLKIRDTQTGLKAYKRKVIEKVLDRLVIKKFCFDIEILAVAKRLGYNKIYDAPIQLTWARKSTSLSTVFKNGIVFNFILDTLATWYRIHILHYYDDKASRTKVHDNELGFMVNTGGMTQPSKTLIMALVNKVFAFIHIRQKTKDA